MSLIEKAAEKLKEKEKLLEQQKNARSSKVKPSEIKTCNDTRTSSLIEKASHKISDLEDGAVELTNNIDDAVFSENFKENKSADLKPNVRKQKRSNIVINIDELMSNNILTIDRSNSIIAEEFRLIKRRLLLNAFSKKKKKIQRGNIIMVTSSQPDEGKTFCALSLALSMSKERDLTVMLIDADVAKPDVLRYMGANGGKGLIDIIEDKSMNIGDCLLKTDIPNLTILPAGKKHNLTTELLASERMLEIIDEIAERYQDRVIIIDSPPVLASSSAAVIALNVGQVLFVVEAERTNETELTEALTLMNGCSNINLILNKTRFTVSKKKFGSYYGYGYNL
jgi:receptor protein-tyrosine kinase